MINHASRGALALPAESAYVDVRGAAAALRSAVELGGQHIPGRLQLLGDAVVAATIAGEGNEQPSEFRYVLGTPEDLTACDQVLPFLLASPAGEAAKRTNGVPQPLSLARIFAASASHGNSLRQLENFMHSQQIWVGTTLPDGMRLGPVLLREQVGHRDHHARLQRLASACVQTV